VDTMRAVLLRELLAGTGWEERTRSFAASLRTSVRHRGDLLLVGTPSYEPWHLAAHLDDEARLSGLPELCPTLVRHTVPAGAAAHLSVGMDRVEAARRGETVFVVAPAAAPETLLERVGDARRVGATVLAIDAANDGGLASVAHDLISVAEPPKGLSIDVVQHLVTLAAGDPLPSSVGRRRGSGWRHRLGAALDSISGPGPQR
jgi:hypothetical protein